MKHRIIFPLLAVLFVLSTFSGCAYITGKPDISERETHRYDDAGIKTEIASALLKSDASKANDVNVHCFNGHVFLIGEADKEFRDEALDVARRAEGVVHVTTHWFPTGTANTAQDSSIEEEIDTKLLFAEDIVTRRFAVDVWGGHVVVTGVMHKQSQIDAVISKIKQVPGVKSVTSYLALTGLE